MTDPALFDPIAPDSTMTDAMRAQIEAWQLAGVAVNIVQRQTLIHQAHAIDLAHAARRPTQISGANRVLLDALDRFGLLENSPAPTGDPWTEFLAAMAGDDAPPG